MKTRLTLKERRLQSQIKKQDKIKRGEESESKRRLDRYIEMAANKEMGFKSKMPAEELFEELNEYLWENQVKKEEDPKKYRLKGSIMEEDHNEEEGEGVCRIRF